jgi:hypothetical protein
MVDLSVILLIAAGAAPYRRLLSAPPRTLKGAATGVFSFRAQFIKNGFEGFLLVEYLLECASMARICP